MYTRLWLWSLFKLHGYPCSKVFVLKLHFFILANYCLRIIQILSSSLYLAKSIYFSAQCSMATDGKYLYILGKSFSGLKKVGTGKLGTRASHVYLTNAGEYLTLNILESPPKKCTFYNLLIKYIFLIKSIAILKIY